MLSYRLQWFWIIELNQKNYEHVNAKTTLNEYLFANLVFVLFAHVW